MSDEKTTVTRRRALKVLGVGMAATGAISIYKNPTYGQHDHMQHGAKAHAQAAQSTAPIYFTAAEMATIAAMSALIIPADEHSPGAKEAGVPAFIDLMVSSSPAEVKTMWRDGLAAVGSAFSKKYNSAFADAPEKNQIDYLKDISKNEFDPKSTEEQFFRAIKGLTVDGYYTSEVGIHKDLEYKGNSYAKNFVGCTHKEHMS
jgi:gluconate 2-dehydrogenase gamma chain